MTHGSAARARRARRTGKTQTGAIEEAISRLLADLARTPEIADRLAAVRRILDDIDSHLTDDDRANMNTDPLYDHRGLPA